MGEDLKKRIIFVDDEQNILLGLKRMLRGMRNEWDMSFAGSGEEALRTLDEIPYDVIVTDMRMPVMDGAQLLIEVKKRYPHMVRIVLSGHSEREMVLKSVGPAHQYLAKPCDADALKSTVSRACALRDLLGNETLKKLLTQMDTLPSVPSLYTEIIEELGSPDSSLNRVGEIISKDVGMSAKILQMVNSAFFGLSREISSPSQAVNLLGLNIVKALVLSVHVFSMYQGARQSYFSIEKLMNHSMTTGALAKAIVSAQTGSKKTIDDSFMAGVLHDVGILVFVSNFSEKYKEAFEAANREKIDLHEAEQRVFGATHMEVGAYLLGLWGIPDAIVEAVMFHHTPLAFLGPLEFGPLAAVHVANVLSIKKLAPYGPGAQSEIDQAFLDRLGMAGHLPDWVTLCDNITDA